MTKQVFCGDIPIGGGAKVSVQSMTNTDTSDVKKTIEQIARLKDAGCDLFRLAVKDNEAARAFGEIKKKTKLPLIADIHFDYRLAIAAISEGADKIRINPGNIGKRENLEAVIKKAKEHDIPIRIGINAGSLDKKILRKYKHPTAEAMLESATATISEINEMGYDKIVLSLKSSDPKSSIESYRMAAKHLDYPLHIGLTESGTVRTGQIKSAVTIGTLLMEGIGDTVRISLTGDPVKEILLANEILRVCGHKNYGIDIVSCPGCARTDVAFNDYINEIEDELLILSEKRIKEGKNQIKVAVMGCVVNGPGEAKEADLGIAFAGKNTTIFRSGEIIDKGSPENMKKILLSMANQL